jgi:hypothetical protein
MSMVAPVSSIILLMVFPPEPMIIPIISVHHELVILGAYGDRSVLGAGIAEANTESIWLRASLPWVMVLRMISSVNPSVLVSS